MHDERQFLIDKIFYGLTNINSGYDSEHIYYFSENDFNTVLDRVERLGIRIMGIEPWLNGEFYDVSTQEDYASITHHWHRKAFQDFKDSGLDLHYAATYDIPTKLLK